MSFEAQLTGFGYGSSMTGEGWPDYVTLDNGGILSVEYETRTYYPVDRHALLALADEMLSTSIEISSVDSIRPLEAAYLIQGYARRIRDACGVTQDD